MKIIISPAKKMNEETEILAPVGTPVFAEKAEMLRTCLGAMDLGQLKKLLACNDAIARLNYDRYQAMDLEAANTPALLAYDGIQYKYMAPQVFETEYFEYVQEHLRILSGFYGLLKPFDAIVPYRLEMQAKLRTDFCRDLYDFWGSSICDELTRDDRVLLNLASQEYSKAVEKHAAPDITFISCIFGELIGDKVVEKGVYVKMARGEMVRYMAENNVKQPEGIKGFDRLGFIYSDRLSEENRYVFLKES